MSAKRSATGYCLVAQDSCSASSPIGASTRGKRPGKGRLILATRIVRSHPDIVVFGIATIFTYVYERKLFERALCELACSY